MSYDLQIWSPIPIRLPPATGRWTAEGAAWLNSGRSGVTTIWQSTPAEAEDAPQSIAALVPDLAWFTELTLHAGDGARSVARFTRLAQRLARSAQGAVFDPQRDEAALPEVPERSAARQPKPAEMLAMSWWFGPETLGDAKAADKLLQVFEELLPQALPRRYGTFEPPQYRYETEGRPALARFLGGADRNFVLWQPTPPVAEVAFWLPDSCGASWLGYRTNSLTVGIDAAMLGRQGFDRKLHAFWRAVSHALEPFYGDVRNLAGYRRSARGLVHHPRTTENHPVETWFWAGIPPASPRAAVLGPPYLSLWPGFVATAVTEGNLAFLEPPAWQDREESQDEEERQDQEQDREEEDLWARAGGLPGELSDPMPQPTPARPVRPLTRPYPPVWPFGVTHDPRIR